MLLAPWRVYQVILEFNKIACDVDIPQYIIHKGKEGI